MRKALAILTGAATILGLAAGTAQGTVTGPQLDGGMFIPVGSVMTTADPDTAHLPMQLTWTATYDSSVSSQLVDFDNAYPYEDQVAEIVPAARTYTFNVRANNSVEAGCSARLSARDANGEYLAGDCSQYYTGYADATDAFTLSGGWTTANCNCWMNGNTLKTTKVGAWASFTLGGNTYCDNGGTPGDVGSSRAVIADYASGRGTAKVYLDGKLVSTISENHATTNRVVIYQKRYKGFTLATHTVKIVVASGRFDLDGLESQTSWNNRWLWRLSPTHLSRNASSFRASTSAKARPFTRWHVRSAVVPRNRRHLTTAGISRVPP